MESATEAPWADEQQQWKQQTSKTFRRIPLVHQIRFADPQSHASQPLEKSGWPDLAIGSPSSPSLTRKMEI
ncbi:hypothetical protein E2562_008981 [Oryza meyeriana var. granulata]|uniref:Uncharacterized protein n=1 Tax=Oryza meyeriana var. granulata TaxID=110450 RepID=A0A6G1D0N6_9ORYZ|nr:hypothetical protein E2562_008981 [Oryza meyeriana var. granulata]